MKKLFASILITITLSADVYAAEVTGSVNTNNNTVSNVLSGSIAASPSNSIVINSSSPSISLSINSTGIYNISVPANTSNASLDLSSLVSGDHATLPGTLVVTSDTGASGLIIGMTMPSGTTVTAATSSWDGHILLPQLISSASVTPQAQNGTSLTVTSAIDVGNTDFRLVFSNAVRLIMGGLANNSVGYMSNGNFVYITTVCAQDTQAWADTLPAGGECYMSQGADMILWTKHFTTFGTYRLITATTPSSSGSGGGGGGGGGYIAPIGSSTNLSNTTVTNVVSNNITNTTNVNSNLNNTKIASITKKLKLKSSGDEVKQLQKLLAIKGFLANDNVTGYFGAMTEKALKAYQKSYNLEMTGAVGPATMKLLNSETYGVQSITNASSTNSTSTLSNIINVVTQISSTSPLKSGTISEIKSKNLNFKIGDENENVAKLQKLLIKYGYLNTKATGYYGVATDKAFKKFKDENQ